MAVYFIQAGEAGPVKIGTAEDVAGRLRELQCGNAAELRLIRTFEGGRAVERWLHRHFATDAIRGEWFRFNPRMWAIDPPTLVDAPFAETPFGRLIASWPSQSAFADDIGTYPNIVNKWIHRGGPPARWWCCIVAAADRRGFDAVTFDILAQLAASKGKPESGRAA